jgi:branched-subunit amino acid transport protein
MALATYSTRYTMIAALGRELSPLLRRWLAYVPLAVLAALIAPAVLVPQGHLEVGAHFWAVLAGAIVAWRSRGMLSTILGGMAVSWILKAVGL